MPSRKTLEYMVLWAAVAFLLIVGWQFLLLTIDLFQEQPPGELSNYLILAGRSMFC